MLLRPLELEERSEEPRWYPEKAPESMPLARGEDPDMPWNPPSDEDEPRSDCHVDWRSLRDD